MSALCQTSFRRGLGFELSRCVANWKRSPGANAGTDVLARGRGSVRTGTSILLAVQLGSALCACELLCAPTGCMNTHRDCVPRYLPACERSILVNCCGAAPRMFGCFGHQRTREIDVWCARQTVQAKVTCGCSFD